jgi:hypothetical protein
MAMNDVEETQTSRTPAIVISLVVLVGLGAVGFVGHLSGSGWFGYRQILYGSSQLYLLNMSQEPLEVAVEGREPVDIDPEGARTVDIVGGQSSVVVRSTSGETVGEHTVFVDNSDALLKLTEDGCLAASEIGAFYGRGGDELDIVEFIEADQQLYVPGSTNLIWPRQTFPAKLGREGGEAIWVELVACALLDEPDFLRAYLDVQLGQRLKKATGKDRD